MRVVWRVMRSIGTFGFKFLQVFGAAAAAFIAIYEFVQLVGPSVVSIFGHLVLIVGHL